MLTSRSTAIILLTVLGCAAFGQIRLPRGGGIKIPINDPFAKGDPITTSIKDARFEDVSKDDFHPECKNLFSLKRTPKGGFILEAGTFGAQVQSYCLHAGTHGPSSGDGYLFAPVKGEYRNIVTHVVQNSVDHPEIGQRDVQLLLWAIVAREKPTDMNSHMQGVAAKLMTKDELFTLNGGAMGILEDDRFNRLIGGMPAPLRAIREAEQNLRSTFGNPNATYEDFERIAMAGVEGRGPGSRDVPSGRWSLHPDGYWVRYIPSGYPSTRLEIYVPEGSKAVGKEFDPATQIAAPADTNRQRLIQSGRLKDN